ncbi:suppressor of cytokine signaling 1-like [Hypanus sabinus]|uniref:suppressor of cytokine signaling 1-like n=1 Tax=Hypanus sabinus TaxID=79690 RepID=UPI0028C4802D|nr:suppressor of cytokine signaling 1-like [Hypanus sabinus]XP_059809481.1 suppressor of cytokine signaling 1-like [Hypanus sabinus]XP_059809482.1 suppressor of cytokine signaling 1-like [Hypanus sabinus]XP_059809483.1 suppressor of cytokine signaling 1-like [Hypanus sabinus]XP_059809484.1 suppressor of cytokine signaling 1-like [Hypanus sabinus]
MVGGRNQLDARADVRQSAPPRFQRPPPESPTHFRTFQNEERETVERSLRSLNEGGFYWGPLPVEKAHAMLKAEPVGTFLVRDSTQADHLFSLSVRAHRGPVSMRIKFKKERFWFDNTHFDCMVKLLEYCVDSSRHKPFVFDEGDTIVFSTPLRKNPVLKLKQLCRKNIICHFGRDGVTKLPLMPSLRNYIEEFPFKI